MTADSHVYTAVPGAYQTVIGALRNAVEELSEIDRLAQRSGVPKISSEVTARQREYLATHIGYTALDGPGNRPIALGDAPPAMIRAVFLKNTDEIKRTVREHYAPFVDPLIDLIDVPLEQYRSDDVTTHSLARQDIDMIWRWAKQRSGDGSIPSETIATLEDRIDGVVQERLKEEGGTHPLTGKLLFPLRKSDNSSNYGAKRPNSADYTQKNLF